MTTPPGAASGRDPCRKRRRGSSPPSWRSTRSSIPPEGVARINAQMPLGRFGEPIEVGALAVYFASPAAAQVTGTAQVIDGGYILSC